MDAQPPGLGPETTKPDIVRTVAGPAMSTRSPRGGPEGASITLLPLPSSVRLFAIDTVSL